MKLMLYKMRKTAAFSFIFFLIVSSVYNPMMVFGAENQVTSENGKNVEVLNPTLDTAIANTRNYILSTDTNPDFNSIWNVIGLVRSGVSVPDTYVNTSYTNIINYLKEKNWSITKAKYTDYSKLILYFTIIGKDARNIEGHNMLAYLSDFENITRQGFNGPIWALIAVNSNPAYRIPKDSKAAVQTTEEGMIEYLLERQLPDGGWTMGGTRADTDITAMTMQALTSYYGKRDDVTSAVNKALSWLSNHQYEQTGGFGTLSGNTTIETSESISQVIVALSALGIDSAKDSRFIKNGKWPVSALFSYYLPEENGFMHVKADAANNGGALAGTLDAMATEQALYAMAAYKRFLTGKTALYDVSELSLPKLEEDDKTTETPEATPTAPETGNASTAQPDNQSTAQPDNPSTAQPDKTSTDSVQTTEKPQSQKLNLRASSIKPTSITLKWNKITGTKGYKIFLYHTSKKKYEAIASVSSAKTSYTFQKTKGSKGKKLTSGTAYTLRVAAYETVKGRTVYKKAEVLKTSTRPEKPSLKLTKKSTSKVKLSWKKVRGSNGYEIYMSEKKKSGYKKIKTVTNGKKMTYAKSKLKKKKTYYFKVRAYKKVGGKKLYSSYSTVKSVKMK